jgi:hypothetical protein
MRIEDARRIAALLALVVVVSGRGLSAQESAEPRDQPHRCRLASQILTTGRPAHKRGWALSHITLCGPEGGMALARALEGIRSATVRTDEMESLLFAASEIEDRTLYEAALRIAADSTAGDVGRVQAMRVLLSQVSPWTVQTYEETVSGNVLVGSGITGSRSMGTPLPSGYEAEVERILTTVADAGPPGPVRNAALNVAAEARAEERLRRLCPPGTPWAVCGARLNAEIGRGPLRPASPPP